MEKCENALINRFCNFDKRKQRRQMFIQLKQMTTKFFRHIFLFPKTNRFCMSTATELIWASLFIWTPIHATPNVWSQFFESTESHFSPNFITQYYKFIGFHFSRIKDYEQIWTDLNTFSYEWRRILVPDQCVFDLGVSEAIYSNIKQTAIHVKPSPVIFMRAQKNPTEQRGMQRAHILDGAALCDAFSLLERRVRMNNSGFYFKLYFIPPMNSLPCIRVWFGSFFHGIWGESGWNFILLWHSKA